MVRTPDLSDMASQLDARFRDASAYATELVQLLDSVGDPTLTLALSVSYLNIKLDGGMLREVLELATRVIELSDDQPDAADFMSVSPIANAMAIRGTARWMMGLRGWREDFAGAFEKASVISPQFRSGTFWIVYLMAISNGVLLSDERAKAEALEIASAADHFGEQITVDMARTAHGITLVHRGGSERDVGFRLLEESHDAGRQKRYTIPGNLPLVDIHVARELARTYEVGRGDAVTAAAPSGIFT